MLKSVDRILTQQNATRPVDVTTDDHERVQRVFEMLHAFYGNLVISKFSTGEVVDGVDQGMKSTLRVWAFGLRRFDEDTLQAALNRVRRAHPQYPPSFPEFEALCLACRPQGVAAARGANGELLLPMAPKLTSVYARRAREVIARHQATAAMREAGEELPVQAGGLDVLKQVIAKAVGEAGGDEAGELLRLDRLLPAHSSEKQHGSGG